MKADPRSEHLWLHQLVGEWTCESECIAGPDQPPLAQTGGNSIEKIGELWVVARSFMIMPDGSKATSIMSLGFDPIKGRFVGNFISSCMAQLWVYDGQLDAAAKVLTLDTEGPSFTDETKLAKYQDIVELISPDHHVLRSQVRGEDGAWHPFLAAHYRRSP